MTSPLSAYGGGYYASPPFPDTPIYDSLVAERGAPQIAPIRVPPPSYEVGSSLPTLPALPALPSASSASSSYTPQHGTYTGHMPTPQHGTYTGYTQAPQPASHPTYPAPAPAAYIPQQASGPRGYTGGSPQQAPHAPQVPQAPYQGGMRGYDAPRPAPPRPTAPGPYGGDQYRRPNHGQGY